MKAFGKSYVTIFLLALISFFIGCKKSTSGGNTPPVAEVEENIVFTINPDPGTSLQPVTGATHNVTITVTSKMPSKGIDAVVDVRRESDQGVVFNQMLTLATNSFTTTITGLVQGVVCKATITLNSKGTTTNTATKSFTLARK